jgi:hypothetical protein
LDAYSSMSAAEQAQQLNRDPVTKRYLTREHSRCDDSVSSGLVLEAEVKSDEELAAIEEIASMIPRNEKTASYFEATETKHFGDASGHGSKFVDPTLRSLNDIVLLAWEQRGGSLAGDDRSEFIARGAKPDAFQDGKRYLLVETPGTVGVVNSEGLSGDAKVEIVRGKPGAPCSIVLAVDTQATTDYAVVIVAQDTMGITETGGDLLITAFPGTVTRPTANAAIDALEGQTTTMAEVRRILGGDTWLNTRLR